MSQEGMTLTILATELYEAARKDNNMKLEVHPDTATFGPAVSDWLRKMAASISRSETK